MLFCYRARTGGFGGYPMGMAKYIQIYNSIPFLCTEDIYTADISDIDSVILFAVDQNCMVEAFQSNSSNFLELPSGKLT